MKRYLVRALIVIAVVFAVTFPALADTIRLKDGTVIRGQIISFKNEQFTILVGSGARGRKSRMTVYMEDVDSIEFDSSGAAGNQTDDSNSNSQPIFQQPANNQPANNQPVNSSSSNPPPQMNQPTSGSNPSFFQINVRVRADNQSN
ncbi:MAG TPA: hypothetical protein VFU37_07430, partial [Pyrinomonadaceae bacterium]|nr:hypothetical protein [Pyrinomonadaceae bacterium]